MNWLFRLEVRVDRDLEYVHLKDQRGSGPNRSTSCPATATRTASATTSPTRDTASHFFLAYLPKGTYVFEYATRVQLRGEYQTGMASIQCLYAPEFNSHSGSLKLDGQVIGNAARPASRAGSRVPVPRATAGAPGRGPRAAGFPGALPGPGTRDRQGVGVAPRQPPVAFRSSAPSTLPRRRCISPPPPGGFIPSLPREAS